MRFQTHGARWTAFGLILWTVAGAASLFAQDRVEPSIRQVLDVKRAGFPALSPDGRSVAYSVRSTDWDDNAMEGEIWIARGDEPAFQLTRSPDGGSRSAAWSPDGKRLAFSADRGNGRQIHLISPTGGEARPLTRAKGGVQSFQWGPDGRFMILRLRDAEADDRRDERKTYGRYSYESEHGPSSHLWWIDVERALEEPMGLEIEPSSSSEPSDNTTSDNTTSDNTTDDEPADETDDDSSEDTEAEDESAEEPPPAFRRLTGGTFTVRAFDISPDGRQVVFDHYPRPVILDSRKSDLSVVSVESGEISPLVERPGSDRGPKFSPDGSSVVFTTSDGQDAYYKNSFLAKVALKDGAPTLLTASHDGQPNLVDWTPKGIYFLDWQRTERKLFHLDPSSGAIRPLDHLPRTNWEVSLSADGASAVSYGQTLDDMAEIWRCDLTSEQPCSQLTTYSDQVADWSLGDRQVVRWQSRDGLEIEGVVSTPDNFKADGTAPLLVVVHGGPSAVSYPDVLPGYVYPIAQWLAKGAVVMSPNYRGSNGYGEAFRSANVDKLGVADAWDVLSGIDHLIEKGWVDPERIGVMGWSQGGYISAFLATTSDRFKGISVGAGISNWETYYHSTDITPFTVHYLSATPWDDPEIYAETSPMTYIRQAKTPVLIQHGENDRRVPISNAYELHRGLQDLGVLTELIVYEDMGHGISRPKERLAAAKHNWQWFLHTIWGEELDLSLP